MTDIDTLGRECPKCGTPVTGRECQTCGINPDKADTVRCFNCGDVTVKADASRTINHDPLNAGRVRYFCPDCQG